MLDTLHQSEILAAKHIIKLGLDKAAESLSFFMKDKIGITNFDLASNPDKAENGFTKKSGDKIYLLVTEIKGELNGVCCLIFNEKETEHLFATCLPQSILADGQKLKTMGEAFLLEMDNIISASVITQFSNILKHKMYGDVPQLKVLNEDELNLFVAEHLNKENQLVNFKINFTSSHLHFCPEFFWLFNKSFVEAILKFTSDSDNLQKLNIHI